MKKTKKICAALLSATIFVGSIFGISVNVNAVADVDPVNYVIPEGFTEVEVDEDDIPYADGAPFTYYQKMSDGGATLLQFSHYRFNYTQLAVLASDYEIFLEVYNQYADQLDFDHYSASRSQGGIIWVYMFDNENAEGNRSKDPEDFINKKKLLIQFCNDLQEADVLESASYEFSTCTKLWGFARWIIEVYGVPEGQTENLQALASAYDEDAVVTSEETENGLMYTINPVKGYDAYMAVFSRIWKGYPNADPYEHCGFFEDSGTSVHTETIDLLTAEPDPEEDPIVENPVTTQPVTDPDPEDIQEAVEAVLTYLYGDPDNDGKITIQDAYNTLLYYAKVSAGEKNVAFTAAGDEAAEQAAFTAADVDKDGKITINDAYLILKYYATKSAGGTPSWDK